jgi:hypothetical protein
MDTLLVAVGQVKGELVDQKLQLVGHRYSLGFPGNCQDLWIGVSRGLSVTECE